MRALACPSIGMRMAKVRERDMPAPHTPTLLFKLRPPYGYVGLDGTVTMLSGYVCNTSKLLSNPLGKLCMNSQALRVTSVGDMRVRVSSLFSSFHENSKIPRVKVRNELLV